MAATRIKAKSPDAKIIIMLREPVEQMYSFHAVRRRNATEDLDFEAALDAEADRREGRRLPRLARNVKDVSVPRGRQLYDQWHATSIRSGAKGPCHHFRRLCARSGSQLRATLEFLGVDLASAQSSTLSMLHMRNFSPRLATLVRDQELARRIKRVVPSPLHKPIGRLRTRLRGWNQQPDAPSAGHPGATRSASWRTCAGGRATYDSVGPRLLRDLVEGRSMAGARHVFIVGLPRTGTTLTRAILNASPDVAIGGESKFLSDRS